MKFGKPLHGVLWLLAYMEAHGQIKNKETHKQTKNNSMDPSIIPDSAKALFFCLGNMLKKGNW